MDLVLTVALVQAVMVVLTGALVVEAVTGTVVVEVLLPTQSIQVPVDQVISLVTKAQLLLYLLILQVQDLIKQELLVSMVQKILHVLTTIQVKYLLKLRCYLVKI